MDQIEVEAVVSEAEQPRRVVKRSGNGSEGEDVECLTGGRGKTVEQRNLQVAVQLEQAGHLNLIEAVSGSGCARPGNFDNGQRVVRIGEVGKRINAGGVARTQHALDDDIAHNPTGAIERTSRTDDQRLIENQRRVGRQGYGAWPGGGFIRHEIFRHIYIKDSGNFQR